MESNADTWTSVNKSPQHPEFTYPKADIERGISMHIYGTSIRKWTRFGKSHSRKFYLDPNDLKSLHWISPDKDQYSSEFKLADIKVIIFGGKSKFFTNQKSQANSDRHILTISYKTGPSECTSLNLEFASRVDLMDWTIGLEYFTIRCNRSFSKNLMDEDSLRELWKSKGKGVKDIRQLLEVLNIHTTDDILIHHGNKVDKAKEKRISLDEFKTLVGTIVHNECISDVIRKYRDLGSYISVRALQKFFEEVQFEKRDIRSCINDIIAYSNYTLADFEDISKVHKTHSVCLVEDISKHHDRVEVLHKKYNEVIENTISIERPKGLNTAAFSKLIAAPNNCVMPVVRPKFDDGQSISEYICRSVAYPYLDFNKSIIIIRMREHYNAICYTCERGKIY
jgi:hypothetical protein